MVLFFAFLLIDKEIIGAIYFIPCIIRTKTLLRDINIIPQAITKTDILKKIVPAPIVSTVEARKPARILATKDDNIHTPINKDASLGGESLDTVDNPTGEIQSSPMV